MEFKVLDKKGNLTKKKINFDNFFLKEEKKNYEYLVYLEIKRYLLSQRQGTHKSKERGELSGSTKKLHRQKGTGSSRKGSIKNPIFKGGGRVFGPTPRKYKIKINKNVRNMVKKFLFKKKIKDNKIKIVEDINMKKPKTKVILTLLKGLNLENFKSLIISEKLNRNVYLSSRNLQKCNVLSIDNIDCFSLLNFSYFLVFESAVNNLKNIVK